MFLVLLTMVLLLTTLDAFVPPVMAANQVVHISGSTISGRKLIFAAGSQNAAPLLLGALEKGYVPPSAPSSVIPLKAAPNGGPPTSTPTLAPASTENRRIKRDMPTGHVVAPTPSIAYPN